MDPHKTWARDEMNTTPNFSDRRLNSGADNVYGKQEEPDELNSPYQQNTHSVQNERQPQYAGAYTMIPPNESRRSKLQRMAQQEMEDLQRWKEENRPGPISLAPAQLGGAISMAEARARQFVQLRQSKLQKKLKQEEMDRRKREEEEENNQRMKAAQREKAYKLEEKRRLDQLQRRNQFEEDYRERTEQFLQSVERSISAPTARSGSPPASSWDRGREYREAKRRDENMLLMRNKEDQRRKSELLVEKQKEQEEERKKLNEMEHRRVNSAFLDKIEGRVSSAGGAEPTPAPPEEGSVQLANELRALSVSPGDRPAPGLADSLEQDGDDHEWVVMKLINNFPYYERDFLKDIVEQCNGDYQQAYDLLQ